MFYLLFYGIIIYLLFQLVKWLVVSVIGPAGKWVVFVLAAAGVAVGIISSFWCYISSIIRNINPYEYYVDKSPNRQEHAKHRSYFFGPGFAQLKKTIGDAWRGIGKTMAGCLAVREFIADLLPIPILHAALWLVSWLFVICAGVTVGALGSAITLILSAVHIVILMAFMAIIYVIFSITWLIDRIYLQIKSIRTSCPNCQTRSVIPMFACPGCGEMHTRLVPGPYGIFHRRCTCGCKLPTTFLMGRSALTAFCPTCASELAASDVQQFALTIVGGTSSGKTVLLSAFYHEFFRQINSRKNISYHIPAIHAGMFRDLEAWFGGEECGATQLAQTSDMYSVLLKSNVFDVDKQFALYDIAGEAFEDPTMTSMLPQKQMRDSDGIVIVIDPLSADLMRQDAKSEGDDTRNYSTAEASTVITNFVTYLKNVLTNSKIRVKSNKPVSVVITKSDLSSISRHISYHKIKTIMRDNPGAFESFGHARDTVSREFLMDIGLIDAVRAIEAAFSEVHYFPVSAIGHAANGEEYEPEHVMEPFSWLITRAQPALAELMDIVTD